jgi:hypothetical protein
MTALIHLNLGSADLRDLPKLPTALENAPQIKVHLPAAVPEEDAEVAEQEAEALVERLPGLNWGCTGYVALRGNHREMPKLLSVLAESLCAHLKLLYPRLYGAAPQAHFSERLPLLQWLDYDVRLTSSHTAVLTGLTSLSLCDNVSSRAAYRPCAAIALLTGSQELRLLPLSTSHALRLQLITPALSAPHLVGDRRRLCPLAIRPQSQASVPDLVSFHLHQLDFFACGGSEGPLGANKVSLSLPRRLRRLSITADRREEILCSNKSSGYQETNPWPLPTLLENLPRLTALSELHLSDTCISSQERFDLFVTLRAAKGLSEMELHFFDNCESDAGLHHECGQLTMNDLDVFRWALKGMAALESLKLSCACDSRYLAMDMESELQQNLPGMSVASSAHTVADP